MATLDYCVCAFKLKFCTLPCIVLPEMGRKRLPDLTSGKAEQHKAPASKKLKSIAKSSIAAENPASSSCIPSGIVEECTPQDEANAEYNRFVWDMWLRNAESAKFVQQLAFKSEKAGAKGVEDIAKVGNEGRALKNASRDLKRKAVKKGKLSPLYWAEIPCWNDDLERCENWDIPFLLPYELMYVLIQSGSLSLFTLCNVMVGSAFESIKNEICQRLSVDPANHVVIGLHTDGVPMQKSGATIEVQSFNFPHIPQGERLLWSLLEKKWFCKCGCSGRHTMDKIWELLVWQADQMLMGIFAKERHDKKSWTKSDKWRATMGGCALGFTASVGQLRADWLAVKQVFSFGGWNAYRMCFKCRATKPGGEAPYDDVSLSALWREMIFTMSAHAKDLAKKGMSMSPLFSLAGFLLAYINIDVLHACDLGSAADAVGAFFCELVNGKSGFLNGATQQQRVAQLWSRIRKMYCEMRTPNRLQTLTPEMIRKKKKGSKPKLRAKAAEMRHLVPIAVKLATQFHEHVGSVYSKTILDMLSRLLDFYMSIGIPAFDANTTFDIIQDFAVLMKALSKSKEGAGTFYLKPKLHLMQELARDLFTSGDPSLYWTYLDEDFVGYISGMSGSRGGPRNPTSIPESVFQRYSAL